MKKVLLGLFVCSLMFSCGKMKEETVIPSPQNGHSPRKSVPSCKDAEDLLRNRTDGIFYETLPEWYEPAMCGIWSCENVKIFIGNDGKIVELYEMSEVEYTVGPCGNRAWQEQRWSGCPNAGSSCIVNADGWYWKCGQLPN